MSHESAVVASSSEHQQNAKPLNLFIALLATLILASRAPDALVAPEFWAEDGILYWKEQFVDPFSLFMPSTGYLGIAPRLIALIADAFPAEIAPWLFNYLTLATMFWLYFAVASLEIRFVWVLPIIMAAVPTSGEILLNPTNLQWHLSLLLPLMAFSSLANHSRVLLAITSLTGPFSIIALPIWLARHKSADRIGLIIVLVSASIQIIVMLNTSQKLYVEVELSILQNLQDSLRQSYGVLTGERHAAISLLLAAFVAIFARRSPVLIAGLIFGLLLIAMANARFSMAPVFSGYAGARYFYALNVFSVWSVVCACLVRDRLRPFALISLGVLLGSYNLKLLKRDPLPETDWPHFARAVEDGEAASVRVTPFTLHFDGEEFETTL